MFSQLFTCPCVKGTVEFCVHFSARHSLYNEESLLAIVFLNLGGLL